MKEVFQQIYDNNLWQSPESVSGTGSTLKETAEVRRFLPYVLAKYEIKSMLDIPCGDLNWISQIDLGIEQYIGADIVPQLIAGDRTKYAKADRFEVLDITRDDLPRVDLMLVRDCLGHFSNADVQKALRNIKRARPKYLLSTTFPQEENEGDIETGQWRPINLASMFGLAKPDQFYPEILVDFADGYQIVKGLGLWRIYDGE